MSRAQSLAAWFLGRFGITAHGEGVEVVFPGVVILLLMFGLGALFLVGGISLVCLRNRMAGLLLERLQGDRSSATGLRSARRISSFTTRMYASPSSMVFGGILVMLAGLLMVGVGILTVVTIIKACL